VDEGGWWRTLIALKREEFDAICHVPLVGAAAATDGGAMALAESASQKKGAKFARWMGPILDALRLLGGAASAKAVLQRIQETTPVPDASSTETLASGQTRFYNEVHWARQELVWEGLHARLHFGNEKELRFDIDLVLCDAASAPPRPLCVLDTKFKGDGASADRDIKQVVAYAAGKGCSKAALVYPAKVAQPFNAPWGKSSIAVRTMSFDLSGNLERAGQAFLTELCQFVGGE
jgi:hypothetical protein